MVDSMIIKGLLSVFKFLAAASAALLIGSRSG